MQAMVDGLLTYSRVTTRSGPPEEVDLEQTLEDAIANLALRVEVSDAELTHDELPIVIADRGQILLLFQNLLENAIKFHPGQPTIHVGASDLGGDVEITIEDDGPGIPEDHLERIFSLFERAGRQGDGHGIGLSICRRIVQWHGGSIGVSSPPGEGARFVITLPKNGPQQPEGSS